MNYEFQKLNVSESGKIWLSAIREDRGSSDRELRIKLLDKLSDDFNPDELPRCLIYEERKLSLIAYWHLDSTNTIFKDVDSVVEACWKILQENPYLEKIASDKIATITDLSADRIHNALGHINQFGSFGNGGERCIDDFSLKSLYISSRFNSISSFKDYRSAFDEMEKQFDMYSRSSSSGAVESFEIPSLGDFYGSPPYLRPKSEIATAMEPNTAFIIMPINKEDGANEDVLNVIKDSFTSFDIDARRADEFQHSDQITDLILTRIKVSEYLIADLSNSRPNVYYEIGYAHALKKKPIFICKDGTDLHFDIRGYNVIFYKSMTELKKVLNKRLEAMTGKTVG